MIRFNEFQQEPVQLREQMLDAVRRVLDSGWYILGPQVQAFESRWSALCGVSHGVGVANGMDAIEIGLRALSIGPGDEVITTPMTAFATVLAILRAGAIPVLADIDPDSAILSLSSVARCVTARTRAVVLVHLYGQMPPMEPWLELCQDHGLALIEDCAQAHLASWRGRPAGSFGVLGAYSFYPTKNLGAVGDAGMLVTGDAQIAQRASMLRNYGQSERYHHPEIGLNSRLDELHAAMLLVRLDWLAQFTQRRREVVNCYRAGMENPAVRLMAPERDAQNHVHHLFVVCTPRRDDLQAHLTRKGVQTLVHYPIPIHQQSSCLDIRRDPEGLASSEVHAAQCLSLPCHPQMTDADVEQVIAAVNSFGSP